MVSSYGAALANQMWKHHSKIPVQNIKTDSGRATVRLEPNAPCRPQHNNGERRTPKKSRQTFTEITGTRKPISQQLSGCKKPETAQANLAM